MAKNFAPRKSKKERTSLATPSVVQHKELFRKYDERLLRGAKLSDVQLSKITLREQVRTKFDDSSIKELAENIKINGLIQPLVIHREGDKFVLICGERRFRAMTKIKMQEAPCFILEGKGPEELLAIQFSENSSREELHYVDKADGIYNYKEATSSSERKIKKDLGISKTEVHRSLLLAKLSKQLKEAAKAYNVEKYVLLEFDVLQDSKLKEEIEKEIVAGKIVKRSQFKKFLKSKISVPGNF